MSKAIAEQSNALSIFWLKKHGYFSKGSFYRSGVITWTYGLGGNKSSIGFAIVRDNCGTPEEKSYIKLNYTHTDRWTGEKNEMDYKIPLTTTPCHYGGVRYWFVCTLCKNGQYCGRRVGVIYNIGKWFGCRHCGEIAYHSQFESGKLRFGSISEPDVEKAYNEVKLKYYNGKLTRKYKRYLRLREKMDDCWKKAAIKFGIKI